jgi:hypothetical protein
MKKFLLGFIIGAIICSVIPIKAAIEEYICYKADYKVMINGVEFVSPDLPILSYKGNTYGPFRPMLEAAGMTVNWNAELGQAEITAQVSESSVGTTPEAITTPTPIPEPIDERIAVPEYPGAYLTTYNDCEAVEYNGTVYVSRSDFCTKYSVTSEPADTKTKMRVFKGDQTVVFDYANTSDALLINNGRIYINISLLKVFTGE